MESDASRQWGIADGNDTTPMEVDALIKDKGKNKGKHKCKGKGKEKGKEQGKEKGKAKSKDKPKEGTPDTSSMKCFFCKEKGLARKDCPKFSACLAEKKTVGHEQSANAIEEDGWILEVGKITTDYRVLDVRRPIWSLGSMMDSGCDVHFTKNRCWTSKDDGKELDMIRSGGVFFVAARLSKSTSKEASTLELR